MSTPTTTPASPANIRELATSALKKSTNPGTLAGLSQPDIEAALQPYKLAISNALPNGDNPDRIIQIAAFKIATTPELAVCSAKSVIGCILNASVLGLNPALGHCHFVPRKNGKTGQMEASFQFDYKGLMTLARRSGTVSEISAEVVRSTDIFQVEYGTNRHILHRPDLDNESEDFTHVYAVIKYTDGGQEFVVLTPAQVEKRRAVAGKKNPQFDFWLRWKAEMWKKTALHFLLKRSPLTERQQVWMNTEDNILQPANFAKGQILEETIQIGEEDTDPAEAEDVANVREGVGLCNDLAELERYWQQNKAVWSKRADIIEVFNARKQELQNG